MACSQICQHNQSRCLRGDAHTQTQGDLRLQTSPTSQLLHECLLSATSQAKPSTCVILSVSLKGWRMQTRAISIGALLRAPGAHPNWKLWDVDLGKKRVSRDEFSGGGGEGSTKSPESIPFWMRIWERVKRPWMAAICRGLFPSLLCKNMAICFFFQCKAQRIPCSPFERTHL